MYLSNSVFHAWSSTPQIVASVELSKRETKVMMSWGVPYCPTQQCKSGAVAFSSGFPRYGYLLHQSAARPLAFYPSFCSTFLNLTHWMLWCAGVEQDDLEQRIEYGSRASRLLIYQERCMVSLRSSVSIWAFFNYISEVTAQEQRMLENNRHPMHNYRIQQWRSRS